MVSAGKGVACEAFLPVAFASGVELCVYVTVGVMVIVFCSLMFRV